MTLGMPLWLEGVARQVTWPFKISWACYLGSKAWNTRGKIEDGVPLEWRGVAHQTRNRRSVTRQRSVSHTPARRSHLGVV
ncbi:hypothetical protein AHAS_Ahas09G0138900 [Arachis hypogaea]